MYVHYRNKIDNDKGQFYENLWTVVDKVPKSGTVIILGALNANLGKEGLCSNDTGKHTLHEETEMVKCYVNLLLQIIW
jgi:hypothetical protein